MGRSCGEAWFDTKIDNLGLKDSNEFTIEKIDLLVKSCNIMLTKIKDFALKSKEKDDKIKKLEAELAIYNPIPKSV